MKLRKDNTFYNCTVFADPIGTKREHDWKWETDTVPSNRICKFCGRIALPPGFEPDEEMESSEKINRQFGE
jgi:hypothetical protein